MKFKIGDKVRIKKGPNKIWEITEIDKTYDGEEVVVCMVDTSHTGDVLKLMWFEDDLEFAEDNIERMSDMKLTKEQLKIIADKSIELNLEQLDRAILYSIASCKVFNNIGRARTIKALQKAYDELLPATNKCLNRNEARTWSTIMEYALIKLLENPRTEQQKEIDSWIVENISTEALDKNIKMQLSKYPGFTKFDVAGVLDTIETVYLEITPEEQYDPDIWTTIVEKALAILEPNKDKLFKIEFKDEFNGYIKEMIIGHEWIKCNLPGSMEKLCLSLSINTHMDTYIDFEEDENVPCIITRIK